jgi:hypothetical protein
MESCCVLQRPMNGEMEVVLAPESVMMSEDVAEESEKLAVSRGSDQEQYQANLDMSG